MTTAFQSNTRQPLHHHPTSWSSYFEFNDVVEEPLTPPSDAPCSTQSCDPIISEPWLTSFDDVLNASCWPRELASFSLPSPPMQLVSDHLSLLGLCPL